MLIREGGRLPSRFRLNTWSLCPSPSYALAMDAKNCALCYFYRHPPPGSDVKPMKYTDIAGIVVKKDGTHPSVGGVHKAVKEFTGVKQTRGRKKGWRKTSKTEDAAILAAFHKCRPPGHGVVSREVSTALPRTLRTKVCHRTIRNRLRDKGYVPQKKLEKNELEAKRRKDRVEFCAEHGRRTADGWKRYLQGCGDLKEYTYYPHALKARFKRYSAPWTYMNKSEKTKPAYQKPKRMFKNKEFKQTRKGKVLGFTTSTGKSLTVMCKTPFNADRFAELIRKRVGPFFAKEFPALKRRRILLDGEPLLHAPPAKRAMQQYGLTCLPNWPAYSPDLNPQENVWPWLQARLNHRTDQLTSFAKFQRAIVREGPKYLGAAKLIPSMPKRVAECLEKQGAMTRR